MASLSLDQAEKERHMPWAIVGLVLVGLWGAFLLPEVIGSRRKAPLTTTQEFTRWSTRIASVQQPQLSANSARRKVLARRRRALFLLFAAAIVSLAAAIWRGAPELLIVHIVIDGAVAWYLAMLVQLRHRRTALQAVTPVRPVTDDVRPIQSEPEIRVLASG